MPINDLGCYHLRLIRQLRLLQLKPFLTGGAGLKLLLERLEPVADRRIVVDVDLAPWDIDQIEPFRLDPPALDVLAAQKRLEQFGRLLVLLDQPVARLLVNNESVIETGNNSP